jgi:hypothetical protein
MRIRDQDEVFKHYLSKDPIVINDLSNVTETDRERNDGLIFTKYDLINSDLLSNIPSCECGCTIGADKLGDAFIPPVVCNICNTPVRALHDGDLEPLIWVRAPEGVDALMNPIIWTMLSDQKGFEKGSFDVMRWICDTTYRPQGIKEPPVIDILRSEQIPRGYNNFVRNFDDIMHFMFNLKYYRKKLDPLKQLIAENRDRIFSKHLPLPNRSILVLEETSMGTYVDATAPVAVNAIRLMVGIDHPLSIFSERVKENRTIKMLSENSMFYDEYWRNVLAKKEGTFRKHVYGTRSHFSFRAVISSLTEWHRYDEVHIPWGIGIASLELHLKKLLMREGMTPWEAEEFISAHTSKYHPKLDAMFQELIARAPSGRGICITLQRNPSLGRASCQTVYVTKVKPQVEIPTISMSILIVKGFNADFDGDQLNCTLALDMTIEEDLARLAPHQSVFDMNAPRTVSKNLSMPNTAISTISNWMGWDQPEEADPEVLRRMALIPEAA